MRGRVTLAGLSDAVEPCAVLGSIALAGLAVTAETCAVRGRVTLVGLSASRTSWPVGRRGRVGAMGLCGAIHRAVHLDADVAVAHRGVSAHDVTVW